MFDAVSAAPVYVVSRIPTPAPQPAPTPPTAEAPTPAPLLLLVEDDDDVRDAGAQWLTDHGFDVVTAASGDLAIAAIQDEAPDIIVLDLMMPGVNGWDVWDWLQATRRNIPVVVWTATGLKTGALGKAPVVTKGQPEELLRALRAVFGKRG